MDSAAEFDRAHFSFLLHEILLKKGYIKVHNSEPSTDRPPEESTRKSLDGSQLVKYGFSILAPRRMMHLRYDSGCSGLQRSNGLFHGHLPGIERNRHVPIFGM
jgi:hypothetical protein